MIDNNTDNFILNIGINDNSIDTELQEIAKRAADGVNLKVNFDPNVDNLLKAIDTVEKIIENSVVNNKKLDLGNITELHNHYKNLKGLQGLSTEAQSIVDIMCKNIEGKFNSLHQFLSTVNLGDVSKKISEAFITGNSISGTQDLSNIINELKKEETKINKAYKELNIIDEKKKKTIETISKQSNSRAFVELDKFSHKAAGTNDPKEMTPFVTAYEELKKKSNDKSNTNKISEYEEFYDGIKKELDEYIQKQQEKISKYQRLQSFLYNGNYSDKYKSTINNINSKFAPAVNDTTETTKKSSSETSQKVSQDIKNISGDYSALNQTFQNVAQSIIESNSSIKQSNDSLVADLKGVISNFSSMATSLESPFKNLDVNEYKTSLKSLEDSFKNISTSIIDCNNKAQKSYDVLLTDIREFINTSSKLTNSLNGISKDYDVSRNKKLEESFKSISNSIVTSNNTAKESIQSLIVDIKNVVNSIEVLNSSLGTPIKNPTIKEYRKDLRNLQNGANSLKLKLQDSTKDLNLDKDTNGHINNLNSKLINMSNGINIDTNKNLVQELQNITHEVNTLIKSAKEMDKINTSNFQNDISTLSDKLKYAEVNFNSATNKQKQSLQKLLSELNGVSQKGKVVDLSPYENKVQKLYAGMENAHNIKSEMEDLKTKALDLRNALNSDIIKNFIPKNIKSTVSDLSKEITAFKNNIKQSSDFSQLQVQLGELSNRVQDITIMAQENANAHLQDEQKIQSNIQRRIELINELNKLQQKEVYLNNNGRAYAKDTIGIATKRKEIQRELTMLESESSKYAHIISLKEQAKQIKVGTEDSTRQTKQMEVSANLQKQISLLNEINSLEEKKIGLNIKNETYTEQVNSINSIIDAKKKEVETLEQQRNIYKNIVSLSERNKLIQEGTAKSTEKLSKAKEMSVAKFSASSINQQFVDTASFTRLKIEDEFIDPTVFTSLQDKFKDLKRHITSIGGVITQSGIDFSNVEANKRKEIEATIVQLNREAKALSSAYTSTRITNAKGTIVDSSKYDMSDLLGSSTGSDDYRIAMQSLGNVLAETNLETVKFNANSSQMSGTFRDHVGHLKKIVLNYSEATQQARYFITTVGRSGNILSSIIDPIGKKMKELVTYFTSLNMLHLVGRTISAGTKYVTELNTALTQFKIITGASTSSLASFTKQAQATATAVASTTSEIMNSATEWSRLGYSAQDALNLAASSAKFAKVGFTDVQSATSYLTSALQAFYSGVSDSAEKADELIDKFVNVDNIMPVSAAEIGAGFANAGAVLKAGGNDVDETISMLTAANSSLQDMSIAASSLRTVSMRIRGVDASELEQFGEETDGLISDASKLNKTIQDLTKTASNPIGISILTNTGEFKSTYEIMKEIANIWEEIGNGTNGDQKQAGILEVIAGKNRAAAVASMLSAKSTDPNFNTMLEQAYNASINSNGVATKAMEEAMTMIESKQAILQQSIESMWQNTLNSGVITFFLDAANAAVNFADALNLITATIPTLYTMYSLSKNTGFFTNQGNEIMILGGRFGTVGDVIEKTTDKIDNFGKSVSSSINDVVKAENSFDVIKNKTSNSFNVIKNKVKNLINGNSITSEIGDIGVDINISDDSIQKIKLTREQIMSRLDDLMSFDIMSNVTVKQSEGIKGDIVTAFNEKQLTKEKLKQISIARGLTTEQHKALANTLKMNEGVGALTASMTAAKLGAAALNLALGVGVSALLTIGLPKIISLVSDLIHAEEIAKEKAQELLDKYKEMQSEISSHANTINNIKDRYNELSDGVDNLGNNISLTKEEFEEYNNICNQIAEIYPSLVSGYDEQGNAIIKLKGNVKELTEALEEEKKAYYNSILDDEENEAIEKTLHSNLKRERHINTYGTDAPLIDSFTTFDKVETLNNVKDILKEGRVEDLETYLNEIFMNYELDVKKFYKSFNFPIPSLWNNKLDIDKDDINSLISKVEVELSKVESELNEDKNTMLLNVEAKLNTSDLDSDMKSVASAILNNTFDTMDIDFIDYLYNLSGGEILQGVQMLTQNVINVLEKTNPEIQNKLMSLFSGVGNWGKKLSNQELINLYDDLQKDLEVNNITLPEEIDLEFVVKDAKLLQKELDDSISKITNVNGIDAPLKDYTSKFSSDQIKIWLKVTNGIKDASEAVKKYEEALMSVDSSYTSSSGRFASSMSNIANGFDVLDKIYADIGNLGDDNNSYFDFGSLVNDDFVNNFSECGDAYKNFLDVVTSSPNDLASCKNAFNDLATEFVIQKANLDDLIDANGEINESLKNVTIAQLEAYGVTNAQSFVTENLKNKQDLITLQSKALEAAQLDLANGTVYATNELLTESGASDTTRAALLELVAQQTIFNNQSLSVGDKIKALEDLTSAYLGTAQAKEFSDRVSSLSSLPKSILSKNGNSMQSSMNIGSNILNSYVSGEVQDFSVESIWNGVVEEYKNKTITAPKVNYSGGSTSNKSSSGSSGGSGSSTDNTKTTKEYINWAENSIDNIQTKIDNLNASINDFAPYDEKINKLKEVYVWQQKLLDIEGKNVQVAKENYENAFNGISDAEKEKYKKLIESNEAFDYEEFVSTTNSSSSDEENKTLYTIVTEAQKAWQDYQSAIKNQLDTSNEILQTQAQIYDINREILDNDIESIQSQSESLQDLIDNDNLYSILPNIIKDATQINSFDDIDFKFGTPYLSPDLIKSAQEYGIAVQSYVQLLKNASALEIASAHIISEQNEKRYDSLLELNNQEIEYYNKKKASYQEELATLNKYSDRWYEIKSAIMSVDKEIQNLNNDTKETLKEKYNNQFKSIQDAYTEVQDDIKSELELTNSNIDYKANVGIEFDINDYIKAIKLAETNVLNAEKEIFQLEAHLQKNKDLLTVETSDVKQSAIAEVINEQEKAISELKNEYIDLKQAVHDANKAMLEAPLKALDRINEKLQNQIDDANKVKDTYSDMIGAVTYYISKEIEALEKKQELQDEIYDKEIEALQDTIDEMEKANDERERALALQKAKYELERAMSQKTNKVMRNGSWTYEADQDAIRDAQEALDDIYYEDAIDKLQNQIDDLNEAKEAFDNEIQEEIDRLNEISGYWSDIIEDAEKLYHINLFEQTYGSMQNIIDGGTEAFEIIKKGVNDVQSELNTLGEAKVDVETQIESINRLVSAWENGEISITYAQSQISSVISSSTLSMQDGFVNISNALNQFVADMGLLSNNVNVTLPATSENLKNAISPIKEDITTLSESLKGVSQYCSDFASSYASLSETLKSSNSSELRECAENIKLLAENWAYASVEIDSILPLLQTSSISMSDMATSMNNSLQPLINSTLKNMQMLIITLSNNDIPSLNNSMKNLNSFISSSLVATINNFCNDLDELKDLLDDNARSINRVNSNLSTFSNNLYDAYDPMETFMYWMYSVTDTIDSQTSSYRRLISALREYISLSSSGIYSSRSIDNSRTITGKSYSKGTSNSGAKSGVGLVSEEQPEIIWHKKDNIYSLFTTPSLVNLSSNDVVFNGEETKHMLKDNAVDLFSSDNLMQFKAKLLNIQPPSYTPITTQNNISNTNINVSKIELPNIRNSNDAQKIVDALCSLDGTVKQRIHRR